MNMDSDNDDLYQRAPFFLVDQKVIKEMKGKLYFDEHLGLQLMYKMHRWTFDYINMLRKTGNKDPLGEMFQMMQVSKPECVITCCKPDIHFHERSCFPIKKVFQLLIEDTPLANYLNSDTVKANVLKKIYERLNDSKQYAEANEFKNKLEEEPVFNTFIRNPSMLNWIQNPKKRNFNVLVVDFLSPLTNINESTKDIDSDASLELDIQCLENLVSNLSLNFITAVTPTKINSRWKTFVENQFNKVSLVVLVCSLQYHNSGLQDSLNEKPIPRFINEEHNFLWKKVEKGQVPTVAVVCHNIELMKEIEKFITPVFCIPKDLEILLGFIDEFV